MRSLYFDCSNGICGNMVVGALYDLIEDKDYLFKEINKINNQEFKIEAINKELYGQKGLFIHVKTNKEIMHDYHDLNEVKKIINNNDLSDEIKEMALKIFMTLAKAEAKVHEMSLDEIHFHEVGSLESIVDIICVSILINKIKPDKIFCDVIKEGKGFIECAHGLLKVPVPVVKNIFDEYKIKYEQIDINTELVTPTGIAIIAALCNGQHEFNNKYQKVGIGLGGKDIGYFNPLKIYLNED